MEFLIGIIIFIAGMLFGSYAFFIVLVNAYYNDPQTVLKYVEIKENQTDSTNDANRAELVVEYHGSQIYMFFKKDDVFAGQGATLTEALEQATQRFPGILFSVEQ
jgi:hypothetical protein